MSNSVSSEKFSPQNQILLMKLSEAYENAPLVEDKFVGNEYSQVQQWIARTGALISKADSFRGIVFRNRAESLKRSWKENILEMHQSLLDTIEEIRVNLELSGRDEIGKIYESGKEYSFFSDLKEVLGKAKNKIFIVDPYFDDKAFKAYFDESTQGVDIRILCSKYANSVAEFVKMFSLETGVQVVAKKYNGLHDRVIFIDEADCWIVGASIKDGGKKPTYLIPLSPQLVSTKLNVYENAWGQAVPPS